MTAKAFGWKSGLVSVCLVMLCCSLSAWAQPTIEITGGRNTTWECSVPYDDMGAIATDSNGEDITRHIITEGAYNQDTSVKGEFYVTYTVTDSTGTTITRIRTVRVVDSVPPVFALEVDSGNRTGEIPVTLKRVPTDPDKKPRPPWWLIAFKELYGPHPVLEGEEEEEEIDPDQFTLTMDDIRNWPDNAKKLAIDWYFYPTARGLIYDFPDWGLRPMQWVCSDKTWEDPGLVVYDACDITVPVENIYVTMAEVYVDGSDVWEKSIWSGYYTEKNNQYLLPAGAKRHFVGYRFYYSVPDTSINQGVAVREVVARYGASLTLEGNPEFIVNCGQNHIISEIERLEKFDRFIDSCYGDLSHEISRTGEILWDTPGTYYYTYEARGQYKQRIIHVNDVMPNITLLDKDQNILRRPSIPPDATEEEKEELRKKYQEEITAVINWCEYLQENPARDGRVEVDEFSLENWWALTPDEGFFVTDGCDDGYVISSQTRAHGKGEISEMLTLLAARGLSTANNTYHHRLWYESRDPRGNKAYDERPVIIDYTPPVLSFNMDPDSSAGAWMPSGEYFAAHKFQCGQEPWFPEGKFDLTDCSISNLPAYIVDWGGLNQTNPEVGIYTVTYSSYPANSSKGLSLQVEVEVVDTQEPSIVLGPLGEPEGDGWVVRCFDNTVEDHVSFFDGCSGSGDLTSQKFIWRLLDDRFVNRVPAIARDRHGQPIDYGKYDRYLRDPGTYVIIYTVQDPDGNVNLPLDEDGIPHVFHFSGGLNIFDDDGMISERFKTSARVLRTEAAYRFESSLPRDEESGFYLLDCQDEVDEMLDDSQVEVCAVDTVERFIWRFQEDGSIKRNRQNQPTSHNGATLKGRFGDYVAVLVSSRDRNTQPRLTSQLHADILDSRGYLIDPNAPYLMRFRIEDTEAPELTVLGDNPVTLLSGAPYIEFGCTAWDHCDGDLTKEVTQSPLPKDLDTSSPGALTVVYTVADKSGNLGTAYRTVNIIDLSVDDVEITMLGEKEVTLECGDHYEDPGVEARYAGESLRVFSRSHDYFGVVGSEVGVITLNYYTTTEHGTELLIGERIVTVVDTTPPVMRLNGMPEQTLTVGQPYFEKGATAQDMCSGALPVRADGKVNASKEGVYTITYSAIDDAGNEASTVRTVTVESAKTLSEGEVPVIGEGEDQGEPREGEDGAPDETGCGGCTGCDGKKISPAKLLGDYLLLGVSLLALMAFRGRG